MGKFFKVTMTTGIICACITMFITYSLIHMSKVNEKIDEWDKTYQAIHEDVSSFTKVSDPKTIRLYVKELNKILDEIHFLSRLIESGQLADEGLTTILNEQAMMNKKILEMVTLKSFDKNVRKATSQRISFANDVDDLYDITEEMDDNLDKQYKAMIKKISIIEDDIDDIKSMLKTMNKKKFMHTHKD